VIGSFEREETIAWPKRKEVGIKGQFMNKRDELVGCLTPERNPKGRKKRLKELMTRKRERKAR